MTLTRLIPGRYRAAGLAAGLLAAAGAGPDGRSAAPPQGGQKASAKSDKLPDADITRAIEDRLQRDVAVPADRIDVATEAGIVTLTGTVDSLLASDRAVATARETKGVRSVIDRLTADRGGRTDEQVQADIGAALAADPATDSYEVTAVVKDGVVTLTGKVQSWAERTLSETVARGVKGVTKVENRLAVEYKTSRPDGEIAADIRRRLYWDRRVDAGLVTVAVQGGAVTLGGTVGSAAEQQRAEADAWVAGVKSVNGDGLKVDKWWGRGEELRPRDASAMKSDDDITKAVHDALLYDPRVFSFNPTVAVRNGAVTLTGTVDNLAAKRAAEDDARNTAGVWWVNNQLKVRWAGKAVPDAEVVKQVRAALTRDPYVDRYQVRVASYGGRVYLNGTVDSYTERARAETLAVRVNGVTDVRNYLTVDYPDPVYYFPPVTARDREIKDDIEAEMFWSPWVQADEVTVGVRGGVATLSGTVDNWSESQAATENAIEGGATSVVNELKVRHGPDYSRPD